MIKINLIYKNYIKIVEWQTFKTKKKFENTLFVKQQDCFGLSTR